MSLGVILALILEVFRLINRAGGVSAALDEVKKVNLAIGKVETAKTPGEEQDAAETVSRTISGD